MATSYTPGLKVLKRTIFKTKRILPLKGDVHVNVGDDIQPDTIVASTNLPGNVQMVKLSNALNIDPKDVGNVLKLKEGDLVRKGEMIKTTVFGGEVGIIFDCRNRPIFISEDPELRVKELKYWSSALNEYPSKAE